MTAATITPDEIRTVRKLKGWTQKQMATELGLASHMSIYYAECEPRKRDRGRLNPTAALQVAEWRDEFMAAGKWPTEEGNDEEANSED